jgi:hypothetical protein
MLPLALVIFASTASGIDPHYDVRLQRREQAGRKYDIAVNTTTKNRALRTLGEEELPPIEEIIRVEFQAQATVIETDERGLANKLALRVTRFQRIIGKQTERILPPGSMIVARAGKKQHEFFWVKDDTRLSKDQESALRTLNLLPVGRETTDDLFGTDAPRKVGSSWAVTPGAVARDAAHRGYEFNANDVDGAVRLAGIEKLGDAECVKVTGKTVVRHLDSVRVPEEWKAPSTLKITGGSRETAFTYLNPVNPASDRAATSTVTVERLTAVDKPGHGRPELTMNVTTLLSVETRTTPLEEITGALEQ